MLLRCFCYWKNFESNQQSSSDQTADFGQVLYNWQLIVQNMYVIDIVLSHVQQCHLKYWLLINTELFWIHEYSLFCTINKCRYVPSSYLNHLDMYPPLIMFKSWKINWACIDPVPSQGWVCNEPGPKTEKRWNKKADEDLLPSNILFFPLRHACFNLSAMFSLHTKKRFNVHTWYRTMQIKTQVIPAPAKNLNQNTWRCQIVYFFSGRAKWVDKQDDIAK